MGAKTSAKRSRWFEERCKDGCQICGSRRPGLKNCGLQWSHIISKMDGGGDNQVNCLALCPTCSDSFDLVMKPAIYDALKHYRDGKVPESWKSGEGRLSEL